MRSSSAMAGDGRGSREGDSERAQKGSEISDVGEILETRPEGDRRPTSSNVFKMTTLGSSVSLPALLEIGLLAADEMYWGIS